MRSHYVSRQFARAMLRLDDPSNNRGLGWKRLSEDELVDLFYIGLKLARRSHRAALTDRSAMKSDEAAKAIAKHLADRLKHYPVFGPARPIGGHTCGGNRI